MPELWSTSSHFPTEWQLPNHATEPIKSLSPIIPTTQLMTMAIIKVRATDEDWTNSSRHILHSQLHYGRVSQHDSCPEAILFNSNRSSERIKHNMYSHNKARHLFSTYRLWENTWSSHNPSDFHPFHHFKRTYQHQHAQHPPKHQIQPGRTYFPQTLSYPNGDRNRTNAVCLQHRSI